MKKQIQAAWQDVIHAYGDARVNTEHTMQAVFFAGLLRELDPSFKVLCEPVIDMPGLGKYLPDILITSSDAIVAVLELKFVPQGYPHATDLQKLEHYAKARHKFALLLNPKTGQPSAQKFSFAPDCLLIYAVIGRHDSKAVDTPEIDKIMAPFEQQFMHLALSTGR